MVEWWGGWKETRVCGGRVGKMGERADIKTNLISATHLGMSFSHTGTSSR